METVFGLGRVEAVALIACALAGTAFHEANAEPQVDLEQGVDTHRIVKDFGAKELKPFDVQILDVKRPVCLRLPRMFAKATANGAGYELSHFEARFHEMTNGAYSQTSTLVQGAKYLGLPSAVRRPFDSEWVQINSRRTGLLGEAKTFDTRDEALNREWLSYSTDLAKHDARVRDFNAFYQTWLADCVNRTVPDSERPGCEARRSQGKALLTQLNIDGAALNDRWSVLDKKGKALMSEVYPYADRATEWLEALELFAGRVENTLGAFDTGDCTKDQHRALQDAVDNSCQTKRSCDPQKLTCDDLRARLALNQQCALSRDEINKTCYKGGDKTHRDEADRARGTAKNCQDRINDECGGVGIDAEPAKP